MGDDGIWVIILAGGEGRRVQAVTRRPDGASVPKQFWRLPEGPTPLELALDRASDLASPERTMVVVSADHEPLWAPALDSHPRDNVVVQPARRGTAPALLLALVRVLERDPGATVVVMPSDHFVEDEGALHWAMLNAVGSARHRSGPIVLLGMTPTHADTSYGWVVPERGGDGLAHGVARFVEKPAPAQAAALHAEGALWSSFILAGAATALLRLLSDTLPELVAALWHCDGRRRSRDLESLEVIYERLPAHDLSADVLQTVPERLRVLPVPPCGWTDLGTPDGLTGRRPVAVIAPRPPARPSTSLLSTLLAAVGLTR